MNFKETIGIVAIVSAVAVGISTIFALREENKQLEARNASYKRTFDEHTRQTNLMVHNYRTDKNLFEGI